MANEKALNLMTDLLFEQAVEGLFHADFEAWCS